MTNLELPVRMSPCLRLFIESLLDDVDGNRSASRASEARVSQYPHIQEWIVQEGAKEKTGGLTR